EVPELDSLVLLGLVAAGLTPLGIPPLPPKLPRPRSRSRSRCPACRATVARVAISGFVDTLASGRRTGWPVPWPCAASPFRRSLFYDGSDNHAPPAPACRRGEGAGARVWRSWRMGCRR